MDYDFYYEDGYSRRTHYIGGTYVSQGYFEDTKRMPNRLWLDLIYFIFTVLWMEFTLKMSTGQLTTQGAMCTVLFSIPFALLLAVICTIFKNRTVNQIISVVFTTFFAVYYCTQLVYNNVFGTYFVVSSIANGGTEQAFNSTDMIFTAIKSRIVFILLMFVPLVFNIIFGKRLLMFQKSKLYIKGILVALIIAVQALALVFVNSSSGSTDTKSNYNLYNGDLQQNAVCERFGLFTMQRIDISRLIFGYKSEIKNIEVEDEVVATEDEAEVEKRPQIIETDYKSLIGSAENDDLKMLYEYFDTATPSYTNKYTGMFEGYNVVFITAESFSHYAVDEELTPTLYKMYNEGFQFDNYYSPAWGVSTTDGEYANLTGLIPKAGVWSFSKSAENNINFPFVLGEQARKLNFDEVRAYHNHTFDYYDRDQYLTNIGYDYSAIGKGLDLGEDVWPNSDLKMMEKTVEDYVNANKFSVYYMSVSGHGGYSYNTISSRNMSLVEHLPYSDEVKGYLASNIELDRAVEYLIAELEKAGKAENTLICITDDHYPYSLDEFNGLDELAGHKVDTVFERYKNSWLLWSASMEEPVKVTTQCSSLDVLPTMLNMLGYEYDSRTITGTDVFGGKSPFVVFGDRSWISQNGKYNAGTGEYTPFENAENKDDIDALNSKCSNMFTISRMVLDNNVYTEIYGDTHVKGE